MFAPRGLRWDISTDVVVVGYGGAGAVAAVTARDEDADAIILEKQPAQSHETNTSMSGSIFISPSDAKGTTEYLEALCKVNGGLYWTERDIIRALVEYATDNKRWIEANGGQIFAAAGGGEHTQLPQADALTRYRFRGLGYGLARFLADQVKGRNIPVMYDTAATRLLTNLKGEVVGVEAENRAEGKAKKIRVRASKGVILTCGGFEFDEQMKLHYLKLYPTYFSGTDANTGDGIRMALEVGADLWHMNCVSGTFAMKFPGLPIALIPDFGGRGWLARRPGGSQQVGEMGQVGQCGYIFTDRYGKRFTSENIRRHCLYYELALFDSQRLIYPRVPSYWLFDRKRIEAGPLPMVWAGAAGPSRFYQWSKDNSNEIAKGWIGTATTLHDLARKLGMNPDVLEATVKTYNRYCEKGHDPDFGTNPANLVPIEPPYYAVELWPGGPNTQGGPKHNAKSQVLNPDGNPIPGLYGAGELGSVFGMLYPCGGGNLTECFAFGRIAGENAARRA